MSAASAIDCLVEKGLISEDKGDQLVELIARLPNGESEILKILVANNIIPDGSVASSLSELITKTDDLIEAVTGLAVDHTPILIPEIGVNGNYQFTVIPGKSYILSGRGDFDSGTAKLQTQHPGDSQFYDVVGASWTSRFDAVFEAEGTLARVVVSGSTSPALLICATPRS
jgi:hypothetical protein